MKDNFSDGASLYARYRPRYPDAVFDYIFSLPDAKDCAWDCGTGNGQIAIRLSEQFKTVHATDISQAQLDHAFRAANIRYSCQPAERTSFAEGYFDLVTIGQAIHWFDFDQFYMEVNRVLKPKGLIVVIGYGLVQVNETIDQLVTDFYTRTVGPYWDKERRYVDENYQTIPFPFNELSVPSFSHTDQWNATHMLGYLRTWSAVKHFIKDRGFDPADHLAEALQSAWGPELRKVHFPILLRAGRKK